MAPHSPPPPVAAAPPCPFCDGPRTEIMSLFGSHASLTTCWCADCRSPFEVLRWRDAPANAPTTPPAGRPPPATAPTAPPAGTRGEHGPAGGG